MSSQGSTQGDNIGPTSDNIEPTWVVRFNRSSYFVDNSRSSYFVDTCFYFFYLSTDGNIKRLE